MVDNKKYVTAKVINKKIVADGKVTILELENEEVPSLSYFTRTFDGKPLYEFIKEGNTYDFTYYIKDDYHNLINAEEVKGEQKTFTNGGSYKPDVPDKDRRISRLAVLNTATAITELKYKHKIEDLKDCETEIIELAENLEKWVYR